MIVSRSLRSTIAGTLLPLLTVPISFRCPFIVMAIGPLANRVFLDDQGCPRCFHVHLSKRCCSSSVVIRKHFKNSWWSMCPELPQTGRLCHLSRPFQELRSLMQIKLLPSRRVSSWLSCLPDVRTFGLPTRHIHNGDIPPHSSLRCLLGVCVSSLAALVSVWGGRGRRRCPHLRWSRSSAGFP